MSFKDNRRKLTRSFAPLFEIKSTQQDIFFDDMHRKTRNAIKRIPYLPKGFIKQNYFNVRNSLMKLIKKPHEESLAVVYQTAPYNIMSSINICSNFYRHAKVVANSAVRKLEQRYSLKTTFYPALYSFSRNTSGFTMGWHGRYKKTPKVNSTYFIKGTMPFYLH